MQLAQILVAVNSKKKPRLDEMKIEFRDRSEKSKQPSEAQKKLVTAWQKNRWFALTGYTPKEGEI